MKRRVLSFITALALCLDLLPAVGSAVDAGMGGGLCPHHPAHTDECGYVLPVPEGECTHTHDDGCYTAETVCVHEHMAECRPNPGESEEAGPVLCAHVCTEESGCVTRTLSCPHEHDGVCGYASETRGAPCAFVCRVCPIEALTGRLPGSVSADNREQVQVQLSEIFALYDELTDAEQEQVDLSPCVSLWEQMDGMGAAVLSGSSFEMDRDIERTTPWEVLSPLVFNTSKYTLKALPGCPSALLVTEGGELTLIGTVISQGEGSAGVVVQSGGSLYITEPGTKVNAIMYALDIASGAKVQLSAGTYYGRDAAAIRTADGNFAALLAPGSAYFAPDGNPILPSEMAGVKRVTVGSCTDHSSRAYNKNAGSPTHTWTCPHCRAEASEPCTFSFQEDGTGTCGHACGNTLKITVDESGLGDLIYDSTNQSAKVTLTASLGDGTVLVKDTDYTVEHSARVDAGEITVTVTGITFNGTFIKTYTVKQDEPGIKWDATATELDYDGRRTTVESELPNITITIRTSNSEDLHPYIRYSYRKSGDTEFKDGLPLDAGEYAIKAYLPESQNYKAAETDPLLTLTIKAINPLTAAPAATKPVYNRAAQALVTPGTVDERAAGAVILFAASQNGGYSATIPTGTNAGDYVVWYKVEGTPNYNAVSPTQIGGAAIRRKAITPKVTLSEYTYLYDGGEKEPKVTVTDGEDGTVLPDSEYQVAYQNNRNAGTANVIVTDQANGNYAITQVKVPFKITLKTQEALTITNRPQTVTYGDRFTLETTGGSGSGSVTWKITRGANVAKVDKNSGQVTVTGTGEAIVEAAKSGKDPATGMINYEDAVAVWTINAAKKPVTATVTAGDKAYDGLPNAAVTAASITTLNGDTVTIDPDSITAVFDTPSAGTGKTVRLNTSSVQVTGADAGKYDISFPDTVTASITPKAAEVTAVPVKAENLTYNGGRQPLLISGGTADGGNLVYSLNGRDYAYDIPTAQDAGSYTVWYKAEAVDENHKDSTPVRMDSVEISANTDTPAVLCTPATFQYDRTEKTPTVVVRDSAQRIIPESEYTVAFPEKRTAAGTYTVTVTDNPGGNYEFSGAVKGTFTIEASSQNPLSITDKPANVCYGDTFRLSAIGGSGDGAIHWSIQESDVAVVDSYGVVTVKDTGGFTVKAYREAADGYSQSNTDSAPFEAKPKPVTPVVTASDKPYDGKTTATLEAHWKSGDLVGSDTITLTVEGQFVTADAGTNKRVNITKHTAVGDNAGRYAITWPDSTTASIYKVDAKLDSAPAGKTLTYDGTDQELVTPGSTIGTIGKIEYRLEQYGTYSESIPTAKDAGIYTVWYKVSDSVNYTGIPAAWVKAEIRKATPSISINRTASGTAGQLLSDITLSDGVASVPGTFTWKNGSSTLEVGTSQQDVVFTPDDTTNYETVTIPIEITITSSTPPAGPDNTSSADDDTPYEDTGIAPSGTPSRAPAANAGMQTTVQNGAANTVVSSTDGDKMVKEAVASQSRNIVIKPEITGDVTRAQVSIPASTVDRIRTETNAALTVSAPIADVTIPRAALETLGSADGTVEVVTERRDQAVVLTLTAGGEKVENIPGGVTLTVPAEDAGPGTVAVLVHEDGTRETIRKSVAEDGKVLVPLSGSAVVEIVDNSKDFTDVPPTSWAADAAAFASARELFSGTSETAFSPDEPMSRGMLATVLYRLEGSPSQEADSEFSDVGAGAWYADGIAWAAENGIVDGYGNGQFGPDDSITREQLAVMLWKYAGSPEVNSQGLAFTDADQASDYALKALRWAMEKGIMSGYGDGRLAPGETATRAEAAQMLKNFLEKA